MADAGAARRRDQDGRDPGRVPSSRARSGRDPESALDSLVHHRLRLGIVSALAAAGALSFNELKALLKTTDGNLSAHARRLHMGGLIDIEKHFRDGKPVTTFQLTSDGRRRLTEHAQALLAAIGEPVLNETLSAAVSANGAEQSETSWLNQVITK